MAMSANPDATFAISRAKWSHRPCGFMPDSISVEKGGIGFVMGIELPLDTSGSSRLPCEKTDKISHNMVRPLVVEGKNVFSISRTTELEDEAVTLALHHWAAFRLKRCLIRWRCFILQSDRVSVSRTSAKELFRRTLLRSAFVALSSKFSSSLYLRDILAEGEATNYRKVGRETLRQWVKVTKTFQLLRSRHDDSCVVAIHQWRLLRKRFFFSTMHQVLLDRGSNWPIAKTNNRLNAAIEWRQKNTLRYGLDMIMRHIRNTSQCRNKMYMASTFAREVILSRHLKIWKSFTSVRAQLTHHLSTKVLFLHRKKMACRSWLGIVFARKGLLRKWWHLLRIALFYWKRRTAKSSARLLNIRGIAETLTLDNNRDHLQQYISVADIKEHERLHSAGTSVRISDMAVGIAAISHLNHLACCEKLRLAQCIALKRALRLFEKKKWMISTVREAEKKTITYALVVYHVRGLKQWQVKSREMRSLKTRVDFLKVLRVRQKAVRMIQLWAEECKRRIHWCVMEARASSMADRSCGRWVFEGWCSVITSMRLERLRCAKATALGNLCLERRIFILFIQGIRAQQRQRSQTALALHWWKSSMQRIVWGAFVQYLKERRLKRKQANRAADIWHIILLRDGAAQWVLAANKARENRLSFSIRKEKENASRRWVLVERCARQWQKTVLRRKAQKEAPTRSTRELFGDEKIFTGIHVKRSPPPSLGVPLLRCNAELSSAILPLPPQRKTALPRSIAPITPTDTMMSFSKMSSHRPPPRRPLELLFDTLDSSSLSSVRPWVIDELNHRHPHGGGNLPPASPQSPSVRNKNGITAASFSQSESQTNKDIQHLQWKDKSDDTIEVARIETSLTCNDDGRGEMVFVPQNNAHANELENTNMQVVPHSSGMVSNAMEGLTQERARLTLNARYKGLGHVAVSDEERIEEDEVRRLADGHALRGHMGSQPRLSDNVTEDGMAREDNAASDRGIVDTSFGAGLPPFETEVRMMNEDGSSAITTTTVVDASPCTDITNVVRDALDTAISSAVTPRRRLQETLAQLEWWIHEWQHQKEIYQQDKMHLQAIHDKFEGMEGSVQSSVLDSMTEKPCNTQRSIAAARSRIEDYRIFKPRAASEVSRIQNRIAYLELEVLRE